MSIDSIKATIENKLSILNGERIRRFKRAALLICVDFGDDVESIVETGAERGITRITPRFAIHAHTSWRLLKDGEIVLCYSDLFSRGVADFKVIAEDQENKLSDAEFITISNEVNKALNSESIRVSKIEANEIGDLRVFMDSDYCLELFIDSRGDTESWRFFRMDDNSPHFVVFDESSNE